MAAHAEASIAQIYAKNRAYTSLADEEKPTEYQFCFYLIDIFGDCGAFDFFSFTL